ncbi:antitoxin Xre/MbcA/ParS toxin-binding domain-containing protein [Marinilabilia rubra]|uniref:Antitoxin Xre/MbcA/ParS-like toxin-binding domain-containing protein n=1 Tax=Marinilabilia rubra TaxID=2162893 RepID=A0A2U2B4L0_9BACT|nr:antitoxin Xre/MbcA/ParS toxin-binding domain-containing protein [Marinilabilia rubra]PWD97993.1 hypothetical protein DDZ16_18145 [Marinilabilia rubra]
MITQQKPGGRNKRSTKDTQQSIKLTMEKLFKDNSNSPKSKQIFLESLEEKNLSSSEFDTFVKQALNLGLTKKEYANYLHVNARTLDRNLKEKFTLDVDKKEKILLLWQLMKRGIEVFGSEEKFSLWIREYNTALQKKPIDLFSSITGIEMANNLLTRIQYGVFS